MRQNNKFKFIHSRFLFLLVLITELAVAGVLVDTYYESSKAAYKKEVDIKFEKAFNFLTARVDSYISTLKGVSAVYLTRDFKVSNKEIRKYAKFRHFFRRFSGSFGFGFIRYVKEKDLKNYVKEMQNTLGKDNFSLRRLSDVNHGDYMIMEALEPAENNGGSMGFDLGSEQKRRSAAMLAVDSGAPVMSEQIELIQLKSKEKGFVIFLPLYENGITPSTAEERRKKIKGWVVSPITIASAKDYLLANIDPSIKFEIYSQTSGQENWEKIAQNTALNSYQFEKYFTIAERPWLFRANYERKGFEFDLEILSLISFFVLSFGFISVTVLIRNLMLSKDSTETRAKMAENWISTVINSSNFCIISTDKDGFISTLNSSAEAVIGYQENEVLGKFSPALFLSKGLDLQKLLSKAKSTGLEMLEIEALKRDGSKFPSRIVITPVLDGTSMLQGFLIILEDITEVVKMRKELQINQQQIIATSRLSSLGEMAAGLAHEINNPLSIISSKVHLTLDKVRKKSYTDEVLEDSLTKIDLTVLRIARLVRGLKNLSRDATSDPMVPASLVEIINDSVGFCEEKLRRYEVSIKVEAPNDFNIQSRSSQLVQVFVNLINNSIDALEPIADKWLLIKVQSDKKIVRIKVVDSGSGINSKIAEKILDPFFTTKETGRGTGLGLSISKTIIAEHKGNLFYDCSATNTTFVIEMPLMQNAEAPALESKI